MKEISMKLGCANQNTDFTFQDGSPRRVFEYQLHEIIITRPSRGTAKQRIICPTCNNDVFIIISSLRTTLLIRLTAIIVIIFPITVLAGFIFLDIQKNSALIGFIAVFFLMSLCLIPFFLPRLFRREHKLAFSMKNPRDLKHRIFEANVENVYSEIYF